MIVGVIVGTMIIIGVVIAILLICSKRKKAKAENNETNDRLVKKSVINPI